MVISTRGQGDEIGTNEKQAAASGQSELELWISELQVKHSDQSPCNLYKSTFAIVLYSKTAVFKVFFMKSRFIVFFISLISICCFSQEGKICKELIEGKFETYEKGKKTGVFYRLNGYQVEREVNKDSFYIARVRRDKCLFRLKSYEIRVPIDTITWTINYDKKADNKYSFIMKPEYLNINYSIKGEIVKIDNKIENEVLKIFNKWNLIKKGNK